MSAKELKNGVCSGEECEDTAKAGGTRYESEWKPLCHLTKRDKKKFQDAKVPMRPPGASFLACFEYHPKSENIPAQAWLLETRWIHTATKSLEISHLEQLGLQCPHGPVSTLNIF